MRVVKLYLRLDSYFTCTYVEFGQGQEDCMRADGNEVMVEKVGMRLLQ